MKKQPDTPPAQEESLRDKIIGLSESSGRKSYYPMLQRTIRELQGEIAERRKVEAQLRQAITETNRLRSLLSNIINSMPSVLIGVDTAGHITQWNQQAVLETGLSEAEVQGQPLEQIVPWLASKMDKVRQAIAQKKTLFKGKIQRTIAGEVHHEDITVYPLITNGVQGAVIRIDDITNKVRIEEMLIQSEKMLSVGGLAAGMAHEINNPLASIMGNAQVVETRLLQPLPRNLQTAQTAGISFAALQSYLEERGIPPMLQAIRSSGAQAAQIVSNMLSFSRKHDTRLSAANLVELLNKTLDLAATDYDLKKNYDFKEIEVIKDLAPSLPLVLCSASQLQQVILNLLRNGAEAMSDKGYPPDVHPCFTIRAYSKPPWVRLEIEDNGPGMEENTRKRIFEPFFTTKSVDKGTGLGLSVSYFIVTETHGGRMQVQTVLGKWTRFLIDLPAETQFT